MLFDCFVSVLGGRLFNLAFRGGRIRVGERGDAHLPRKTRPPADAALPQHCRTTNLQVTFSKNPIIRGVRKKSGPGVKSSNFSANIRPTETFYKPNLWKLIKVFYELCRFKITALIE